MALPTIEEITEATQTESAPPLVREYQDYLDRLEDNYLTSAKALEFVRDTLITFTANAANTTVVYLCIDFGMNWLTASIFGFGVGLIPAAYHLNNAGIDLGSEYKVKRIGSLLVATGCTIAAFSVSYRSGSEQRTLVDFTKKGFEESAKEVANYEIKVSPVEGINLWFNVHFWEATGNLALLSLIGAFLWKYLFSKRF